MDAGRPTWPRVNRVLEVLRPFTKRMCSRKHKVPHLPSDIVVKLEKRREALRLIKSLMSAWCGVIKSCY